VVIPPDTPHSSDGQPSYPADDFGCNCGCRKMKTPRGWASRPTRRPRSSPCFGSRPTYAPSGRAISHPASTCCSDCMTVRLGRPDGDAAHRAARSPLRPAGSQRAGRPHRLSGTREEGDRLGRGPPFGVGLDRATRRRRGFVGLRLQTRLQGDHGNFPARLPAAQARRTRAGAARRERGQRHGHRARMRFSLLAILRHGLQARDRPDAQRRAAKPRRASSPDEDGQ
jgi:hypothetical protein